jgi:hypothetical protein
MARITSVLSFDWRETPDAEAVRDALKPFGIFTYENKLFDADGCYCLIVTRRELNDEQLASMTSDRIDAEDDIFTLLIPTDETLSLSDLEEVESPFNILVYQVDTQDDSYMFLFSNEELTDQSLEEAVDEYFEGFMNSDAEIETSS